MNVQSWAWRLYADTAPRRGVRFVLKSLRWGASVGRLFRVFNLTALLIGAFYLVNVYWTSWATLSGPGPIAVGVVAFALMIRGGLAQVAGLCFPGDSLAGGLPIERRFDLLVPEGAAKVALVGQNLATSLGNDGYAATYTALSNILNRKRDRSRPSVGAVWLVMQTPLALMATHPKAADHLRTITIPALRRLATDLGGDAERVTVAFHPAATLSMTAWDWGSSAPMAVILPKLQTTVRISDRLSVLVEGASYGAVSSDFERFLFEAERQDFPGASTAKLSAAADALEGLFTEPILASVQRSQATPLPTAQQGLAPDGRGAITSGRG